MENGLRVLPLKTARDLDRTFGTGGRGPYAGGLITDAAAVLRGAQRTGASSIDTVNGVDSLDGTEAGDVERRQFLQALGLTGVAGAAGTFGQVEAVRATLEDALGRSVEEWQELAWDYGRDYFTLPPVTAGLPPLVTRHSRPTQRGRVKSRRRSGCTRRRG